MFGQCVVNHVAGHCTLPLSLWAVGTLVKCLANVLLTTWLVIVPFPCPFWAVGTLVKCLANVLLTAWLVIVPSPVPVGCGQPWSTFVVKERRSTPVLFVTHVPSSFPCTLVVWSWWCLVTPFGLWHPGQLLWSRKEDQPLCCLVPTSLHHFLVPCGLVSRPAVLWNPGQLLWSRKEDQPLRCLLPMSPHLLWSGRGVSRPSGLWTPGQLLWSRKEDHPLHCLLPMSSHL